MNEFNLRIASLEEEVVYMPVRHHSPVCARIVREVAERIHPSVILVEGPADYNDQLAELTLEHRLPVAIYSYVRNQQPQKKNEEDSADEPQRYGAFYPFCEYSPEYQALRYAAEQKIPSAFIDLPWRHMASVEAAEHRYHDGDLRNSGYTEKLCEEFGVPDFDALWDLLFEIPEELDVEEFFQKFHSMLYYIRLADQEISWEDCVREQYMADQISNAHHQHGSPVLVVTGGYHSYALFCRQHGQDFPGVKEAVIPTEQANQEAGLALTPYSFHRLDKLTGYQAGMPGPGYYQMIWNAIQEPPKLPIYQKMIQDVAKEVRKKKQVASTADLIALETTVRALADIRGHSRVWRRDLIDGVIASLVKDEMSFNLRHPFLEAVYEVFRGERYGRLADGVTLPPIVTDIRNELERAGMDYNKVKQTVEFDLEKAEDLAASHILHRCVMIGLSGLALESGVDFLAREDLTYFTESWSFNRTPNFEADCIEAAIYGVTLAGAAESKLHDAIDTESRSSARLAEFMVYAARMGLHRLTAKFRASAAEVIAEDSELNSLCRATGHFLFLYRYDEILGYTGNDTAAYLLEEAWNRALYILEGLGQLGDNAHQAVAGMEILIDTLERVGGILQLDRDHFVDVLHRVSADTNQEALLRGAAAGALWTLGEARTDEILSQLNFFSQPDTLGDFLTGVFTLAREASQREPMIVEALDGILNGFGDDEFMVALPSLRLAFSQFTPREKIRMLTTLFGDINVGMEIMNPTAAPVEIVAAITTFEKELAHVAGRFGIKLEDWNE